MSHDDIEDMPFSDCEPQSVDEEDGCGCEENSQHQDEDAAIGELILREAESLASSADDENEADDVNYILPDQVSDWLRS